MKKSLLTATLLLIVANGFAQVRYGITGSGQGSTISASVDLTNLGPAFGVPIIPVNARTGFRAGLMADFPLSGRFSIRPQLLYSAKGGDVQTGAFVAGLLQKFSPNTPTTTIAGIESKAIINYMELPVQLLYGFFAGPGRLLVGAGPYAAVAVGGSINGKAIDFNTSNFRKLDLGITASVGYELTMGLSLSAYYTHGLTNISKNSTPNLGGINPLDPAASLAALDPSAFGGTLHNRSYGISVGYLLPSQRQMGKGTLFLRSNFQ